jgi:hypothetical protein
MSEFGVRIELCVMFNILHPIVVDKCHLMCADSTAVCFRCERQWRSVFPL